MLGWKPKVEIRGRRQAHARRHRTLARCAALGSRIDRASATETWFRYLGKEAPLRKPKDMVSLIERYRHKIKTPEELREISARRRARGG